MIDLSGSQPFAEGGNRWCFQHPHNPNRCLKVVKPGVAEQRFAERAWYRRLRGPSVTNDNAQEARAYRQRAIIRGGPRICDHLPRFYGQHETTLGPANELDFIGAGDQPAPTLDALLREHGLDEVLNARLEELATWLRQTQLLTRNLLPHNMVLHHDGDAQRIYLIDGIAPPFSARILGLSKRWRSYWVERRIRRMWLRVRWEARGRKGRWEDVEAADR